MRRSVRLPFGFFLPSRVAGMNFARATTIVPLFDMASDAGDNVLVARSKLT